MLTEKLKKKLYNLNDFLFKNYMVSLSWLKSISSCMMRFVSLTSAIIIPNLPIYPHQQYLEGWLLKFAVSGCIKL